MALAPGVRLGPYEVLAAIGKGGMGEVYRATYTKLEPLRWAGVLILLLVSGCGGSICGARRHLFNDK